MPKKSIVCARAIIVENISSLKYSTVPVIVKLQLKMQSIMLTENIHGCLRDKERFSFTICGDSKKSGDKAQGLLQWFDNQELWTFEEPWTSYKLNCVLAEQN